MKKYYKLVDGEPVLAGSSIVFEDKRIFNPSEEQLIQAGYIEVIEQEVVPYIPSLNDVISAKISEIQDYDSSEEVNSFTINDEVGWIDRNTRVALLHALDVVEQQNEQQYTVWFNNTPLTLPINTIRDFLNSLELYAIAALNVTNRHIYEVNQLTTIEEVNNYDITQGYPQKINLIL